MKRGRGDEMRKRKRKGRNKAEGERGCRSREGGARNQESHKCASP